MSLLLLLLACQAPEGSQSTPTDPAPRTTGETGETGGTGSTGTAPLDVTIALSPRSHSLDVVVLGDLHRAATLSCVAPAVEDEAHRMPLAAGTDRTLLQGLLADTTYQCQVLDPLRDDQAVADGTGTTPPADVPAPWHIVEHDPSRSYGAYTLFNVGDGDSNVEPHQLVIVDALGRLRWTKLIPDEFPDCDATLLLPDQTVLYGGGQGISPTIETLAGEVLWQAPERPHENRYHHHAERLPSGEVLTMTHTEEFDPSGSGQTWIGFQIERWNEAGEMTWSWTSQRAVDEGWLPVPGPSAVDPWHANSVAVDEQGITYVNLRQKSWLLAIDPDGQVLWRLGNGGDFTLVDAAGTVLPNTEWFYGAHAPEHYGDRILFHDNGYGRAGIPRYSQALEMIIDTTAMTATPTWSWTEDGWYEPIWGDIDELPTGNILLGRGHCGSCTPDDQSEVTEVHRDSGDVVWRLAFDDRRYGLFRAQRIDGCDLFHRVGTCAEGSPRP